MNMFNSVKFKLFLALIMIFSLSLPLLACKQDTPDADTDLDLPAVQDLPDDADDDESDIKNFRGLEISSPDDLSQGVGVAPSVVEEPELNSAQTPSQVNYGLGISTSNVLASQAAAEIISQGGNAFDAAVAASFVLGVVEPHASGIGGSGVMLYYLADQDKYDFLDYRTSSGLAETKTSDIGIPGFVSGLGQAQKDLGKLTWAQTLAPAIKLARDGFMVNNDLAHAMGVASQYLAMNPAFVKRNGNLVQSGDLLVQPALAETMEILAKEGPESFYTGKIADLIAEKTSLTKEDLAAYKSYYRQPVQAEFRGQTFVSAPPPCSGITLLQMLRMADLLKLKDIKPGQPEFLPAFEKLSLVAYDRQKFIVGDPQHIKFNPDKLLSDEYLQKYLDRDLAQLEPNDSTEKCTTHISIVDNEGNIVSMTNTLTSFWGSVQEVGGFYLNNTLNNFSNNKRNHYRPMTRPRSFIAPTIVVSPDGGKYAIGTPGGKLIPKLLFPVLLDYYNYGTSLEEAINRQRFFFKGKSAITLEEDQGVLPAWPINTDEYYITRYGFHDYFGSVAVAGHHPDGTPFAISDFRRQGLAIAKSAK